MVLHAIVAGVCSVRSRLLVFFREDVDCGFRRFCVRRDILLNSGRVIWCGVLAYSEFLKSQKIGFVSHENMFALVVWVVLWFRVVVECYVHCCMASTEHGAVEAYMLSK